MHSSLPTFDSQFRPGSLASGEALSSIACIPRCTELSNTLRPVRLLEVPQAGHELAATEGSQCEAQTQILVSDERPESSFRLLGLHEGVRATKTYPRLARNGREVTSSLVDSSSSHGASTDSEPESDY